MARVLIFGSRDIIPSHDLIRSLLEGIQVSEIIEGGCRGVDQVAGEYGRSRGIKVTVVEPKWELYGKAAGPIRNSQAVKIADQGLAIWDGRSPGTKDTINKLKRAGKPVKVHIIK